MKNLKKIVPLGIVLCLLSFMLTSCLKDNNITYPVPSTALLLVAQGSPDAPAESLFLDQNQVNNSPFSYPDYIGYFNAYTGNRKVELTSFVYPGQGLSTTKYAADTISLFPNQTYSLFIANTYTKPDFVLLHDTINPPASGMATVRLVNVSPDAGAVDMISGSTPILVSNVTYKGASAFVPVAGSKYYKFSVRVHGSGTVIAATDSIGIAAGAVYTVWLHGLVSGTTTTKVAAGVIGNARF